MQGYLLVYLFTRNSILNLIPIYCVPIPRHAIRVRWSILFPQRIFVRPIYPDGSNRRWHPSVSNEHEINEYFMQNWTSSLLVFSFLCQFKMFQFGGIKASIEIDSKDWYSILFVEGQYPSIDIVCDTLSPWNCTLSVTLKCNGAGENAQIVCETTVK